MQCKNMLEEKKTVVRHIIKPGCCMAFVCDSGRFLKKKQDQLSFAHSLSFRICGKYKCILNFRRELRNFDGIIYILNMLQKLEQSYLTAKLFPIQVVH